MNILILDIPITKPASTFLSRLYTDILAKYEDHRISEYNKHCDVQLGPARTYSRGLLILASVLLNDGANVVYLNSEYHANIEKLALDYAEDCDLVLGSCKSHNYFQVLNTIQKIKEINPRVCSIIGGPQATFLAESNFINPAVDIVVMGEGEITLREVYKVLSNSGDLSKIKGILYRNSDGTINKTSLRPLISDLDILPMPAYDLLPSGINSYQAYIDTSRGCAYSCAFCSASNFWHRRIRTRSPQHFMQEFEFFQSNITNYNHIVFSDSIFGVTKNQILILQELKHRHHNFKFLVDVKVNTISPDMIEEMMRSGFYGFSLGIESCSDHVLSKLQKQSRFDEAVKTLKRIKAKSAFLKAYWIIGLPFEDHESLFANCRSVVNLLKQELVDIVRSFIFVPYPGSSIFQHPHKYGIDILTYDWDRYESRSFPPVYRLENISECEIYSYYILFLSSQISYYRSKYGEISTNNLNSSDRRI